MTPFASCLPKIVNPFFAVITGTYKW